ncbi:dTDP-4-dehydrorhamnose reductase [candidate division KSB1 bacterium]|nr:MAG: dTDP-4-dehydrorhamnose reductase [candidate division KSB1 bacterium]
MNRILLTGHKGMLGRELFHVSRELGKEVIGVDLPECDITNRKQTETAVFDAKPDFILHAAAFTAVDRCESEADMAYLVNATGTQNVCLAAQKLDVPLMYLSTDYIFDSAKPHPLPYDEWDAANPMSVYGKSKWAGECFVRDLCAKHFIVRISWLCGHGGTNFVETILKLAKERDELKVVNDQHGSPTFVNDLVPELIRLSENGAYGTYHITNRGFTTWFEFAKKIVELTGLKTRVMPCTTEEFPRPAPRPKNSRLSPRLYENTLGNRMPTWEEGLKKYLGERP